MSPTEADQLAKRIINCWHGGPPLPEWRIELEQLDPGRAGATFARLKHKLDHAPTIAQFLTQYNALSTTADSPTPDACIRCDGTGYVPAPDYVQRLKDGTERRYTQVQHCNCQRTA